MTSAYNKGDDHKGFLKYMTFFWDVIGYGQDADFVRCVNYHTLIHGLRHVAYPFLVWQDSGPCYSSVNIKRHDGHLSVYLSRNRAGSFGISSHIKFRLIWSWYRKYSIGKTRLGFWRSPAFGYSVRSFDIFFSTTGNEWSPHHRFSRSIKNLSCSIPWDPIRFFIIIISTIPGVLSGILLEKNAESVFRNPILIAATLSLGGLILFYADRTGKKNSSSITLKKGLLIGFAQAFAIIPGISRSGITIAAALILGLTEFLQQNFRSCFQRRSSWELEWKNCPYW